MKLVIQRVKEATVKVNGKVVGHIGQGVLVFLGVHKEDLPEMTPWFVQKLLALRIFSDAEGKMNLSITDVKGQLLIVSQFTLYANCMEGRRPDFGDAAPVAIAKPIYEKFVAEAKQHLESVETGIFGAPMEIALINDGPLTLILERGKA